MYSDIPQEHPSTLMSVYKELYGKYSIITLIIDEIVRYMNKIIQLRLINKSQNLLDIIIEGKFSHKLNEKRRFNLLDFLISSHNYKLEISKQ